MMWKEIGSAPKDGSCIFLKGPKGGKVRVRWYENAAGISAFHTGPYIDPVIVFSSSWMPVEKSVKK